MAMEMNSTCWSTMFRIVYKIYVSLGLCAEAYFSANPRWESFLFVVKEWVIVGKKEVPILC
ncbi:hypothetical protein [Paenibacillus sp. 481]|uniref:hypothetical protein n=1 Tax=Paenibacillus sp. 481 TaxID=2835869 RepID=UPI001E42F29E|nr:hypothetical protein [Paenibacillus sp. 481]UHA75332.1 hypothetical protein KIK04_10180 [Paenibacillus sp. 481]